MSQSSQSLGLAGIALSVLASSSAQAQCNEQLVHANDTAAGDYFGTVAVVEDQRALITAVFDDGPGDFSGSAYVFERQASGQWLEVTKLRPSDNSDSNFGYSGDLEGDRIIVGANADSEFGLGSGAVYVFERQTNGSWREVAKITASDASAGASFGISVSLFDTTMLIGSRGGAYLFHLDGGLWTETAKLVNPSNQPSDFFGWRVALSDTVAVATSPEDDDRGLDSGSVFIFDIANGEWLGTSKQIYASDSRPQQVFGTSVTIDQGRVAIGATGDDRMGTRTGAVYLFEKNGGGTWQENAKLVASDGSSYDDFGWCLSWLGDLLVIGAPSIAYESSFQETGRAYLFNKVGALWTEVSQVTSPSSGSTGQFAAACSTDGHTLLLGANLTDYFGPEAGSASFYDLDACGPTLTADGSCPGGGAIRVEWTRATPDAQIALIFAGNQGTFAIPTGYPCAGTQLGLGNSQIQVAYQGPSGATGAKVLNANAGPGACGGYLQLLDISTCQVSNVARIQ